MFPFIKALFFSVVFFPSFSSEKSALSEREKQLCDFKKNYIKSQIYVYRPPYFYERLMRKKKVIVPMIDFKSGFFQNNPWELKGTQINTSPFKKKKSMIHWLKYNKDKAKNSVSQLCKSIQGACFFKVVYEGELHPTIEPAGDNSIKYMTTNLPKLRISIRDGHNTLLRFPTNCPK